MLKFTKSGEYLHGIFPFFILDVDFYKDMEISLQRLAVFPSDLQRITGQSERTCQRILSKIRDMFGLDKHQHVTVYQVSEYLGIPVTDISQFIY